MTKKKTKDEQSAIDAVFGSAASITPPEKKARKGKKDEHEMPAPFDAYVALHIVANMVKKPAEAMASELKEKAIDIFDEILTETGGVETFMGYLGDAQANIQCKKSPNVPAQFVEMMRENDIPFEQEEQQAARYVINPDIVNDQDLLGKLAVALQNVPGLEGLQVVQKQLPSVKVKPTAETLREVSKIKDRTLRRALLDGITIIAFGQHKMPTKKAFRVLEELDIFGDREDRNVA